LFSADNDAMNVNVKDLVGEVCMTYEDGAKIHSAYRAAFDLGETVQLDFAGTRIFVSRFFNAAVGQLLQKYSKDEVQWRLIPVNLPFAGAAPLRQSIDNAERYYRDPNFQTTLDSVLEAQAAEA
jgi:hypothetical protein